MRLSKDAYFMELAITSQKRADCLGRTVGAIIVKNDLIIATGYNGTPSGFLNCTEGGCIRCAKRHDSDLIIGKEYDSCICVHAEQNCILAAARFGHSLEGGSIYSTLQPCFGCVKELLQAGVRNVYYKDPWNLPHNDLALISQYESLASTFNHFIQYQEH